MNGIALIFRLHVPFRSNGPTPLSFRFLLCKFDLIDKRNKIPFLITTENKYFY